LYGLIFGSQWSRAPFRLGTNTSEGIAPEHTRIIGCLAKRDSGTLIVATATKQM
jgi:hypothetical protein